MKNKGLMVSVLTVVVVAVVARFFLVAPAEVFGQSRNASGFVSDAGTQVLSVPAANGGQYVVIVDTTTHVLGSYHVNADDGHISLRSVRSYQWDLQMNDFNGAEPKPSDVRTIVEQR